MGEQKTFSETLTGLFVELRNRMYQQVRDNPQVDIRIGNSRFVGIAENRHTVFLRQNDSSASRQRIQLDVQKKYHYIFQTAFKHVSIQCETTVGQIDS
ncbi:MAG: hypothetical protein EG825_06710 [Rhodocyclaceae bacterium]|nr:hypothetical protein [Rhodocyclaceae bacterium]